MGKKKVKVKSNKNSPLEEVRKKNPGWGGSSPSSGGVGEASPSKILVIQQKMIGDVLVSSLICENLKLNYPEAEVHYVVNRFTIPVIENNPYIDEIVVFEDEYRSNKFAFYKFLKHIRQSNYDVVIDAYGKLESNLITMFSGAEIKIGWKKKYKRFLYTHVFKNLKKPKTEAGLAIEDRLNLLSVFNLQKKLKNYPQIYLTLQEKKTAKQTLIDFNLNLSKPIFMISVLGSSPSKTYPLENMTKVLNHVAESTDAQLVFNYMPSQKKQALDVYNLCRQNTQNRIELGLSPKSLRDFIAITSFCDALLGNEGGAVNIAKALDTPTFTIFSPWIDKKAWGTFEDSKNNMSVHLEEIKPEFYEHSVYKDHKMTSENLYKHLNAKYVIKKLDVFLNQIHY